MKITQTEIYRIMISLLMMISGFLACIMSGLIYPKFAYETLLMVVIFSTGAPLFMVQSMRIDWWIKAVLACVAVPTSLMINSIGGVWADSIRWPEGKPINDAALNAAAAEGAFRGLLGIFLSASLTVIWIALIGWREARKSEVGSGPIK